MRRSKGGRLVGADLDWFIIPVRKVATWAAVVLAIALAAIYGYRQYVRSNPSAEERARVQVDTAADLLSKATKVVGTVRPGSNVSRARAYTSGAGTSSTRRVKKPSRNGAARVVIRRLPVGWAQARRKV